MTTQHPNNVGWVSEPVTRGTSSLLYTCISTTIICTWSALHLNVPREGSSAASVLSIKIVSFVFAIIAPEYFVACAVREWFAARRLSKTMAEILPGERNWSHAFSHLVLMGGVKFRISSTPNAYSEAILFAPDVVSYARRGWTRFKELSTATVEDKSKANGFNKAVASIQILWFFSQLIGRLASHIVVSPLEWFTLAYVMCAFAMYGFWWHKPFDVQTPILVYPDPLLSAGKTSTLDVCVFTRKQFLGTPQILRGTMRPYWTDNLWTEEEHGEVSYLWLSNNTPMTIGMAISTVLFGACHLLGWNYPFPSPFETYMWRCASVSCVCIPLVVLAIQWRRNYPTGLRNRFQRGIVAALVMIYVPVRLLLLFEVFFALRSAPPEIYKAVPWAQHIPHI